MEKPFLSRKRVEIAFAVLLVAAYVSVPFFILPRVCLETEQSSEPASYSLVVGGKQTQTYSTNEHKGSVKPALTTLAGEIQANGRANPINQIAKPPQKWGVKFWCETRASDFAVGLFTLFLFIATYFLWRETERLAKGADDQADKMERTVSESARAATAMEGVAASMKENVENAKGIAATQREFWQMQMRAYISVVIGTAVYQERDKEIRFAGHPRIMNDGMTPAHNVRTFIRSTIVKFPIPENFKFDLPEAKSQVGPAIGPRQHRDIWAVVDDFVGDQDVKGIKDLSGGRCLFCWGKVTYDDAFGKPHTSHFAQILYWKPNDSVWGVYEPRHNDSD